MESDIRKIINLLPEELQASFVKSVALSLTLTPMLMEMLKDQIEQPHEASLNFGLAMGIFAAQGGLDALIQKSNQPTH
jgi:multidrug efflux pump subunit AcrB